MPAVLARLLLGAAIAVAVILAVDLVLHEDTAEPTVRAAFQVGPEPPSLSIQKVLPDGVAWLIYLRAQGGEVPEGIRPLVAVDGDGSVRLLRPAPIASSPNEHDWLAAGIVLPTARLAELEPVARATVLELIRRWRGGLDLPWRMRVVAPAARDEAARDILLRFLR